MTSPQDNAPQNRLFDVATDANLSALIGQARQRILLVAPALTVPLARALTARLREHTPPLIELVLDADPEVYRLGYGEIEAFEIVREHFGSNYIPIRHQEGIRIAVLVCDEDMLVWSPTPHLIEAGSTSQQKPNALRIGGAATSDRLAEAIGAATAPAEIGRQELSPDVAEEVVENKKRNPPQSFDVARAVRVFSSQARYVEWELRNSRFTARTVRWPEELLGIADGELRRNIEGRFKPFADWKQKVRTTIIGSDESEKELDIDEKWLARERKEIEKLTFEVKGHGRVILRQHQAELERRVKLLTTNTNQYRIAFMAALEQYKDNIVNSIVQEFLESWINNPPADLIRFERPSDDVLRQMLKKLAVDLVDSAISFEEAASTVTIKDIAPESLQSSEFMDCLEDSMRRARVPEHIIKNLWTSFHAARQS